MMNHDLELAREAASAAWGMEAGAERDFQYGRAIQKLVRVCEAQQRLITELQHTMERVAFEALASPNAEEPAEAGSDAAGRGSDYQPSPR
jgi:hypothetical protein